jgi:hypothetical protein
LYCTTMCFGISISQQFEQNVVVYRLLAHVCSMTTPEVLQLANRATDSGPEVLPHSTYSPGLEPSDFHIYWPLKDALRGRHVRSDEKVKKAMHDCLAQQPKDFFFRGIYALVGRWRRCAGRGGDCAEGKCHCASSTFTLTYFM